MNEEVIDNQDSVELTSQRKPIHLTIVSIGAFLLISLALLILMDLLITSIAHNLAIAHAQIGVDAQHKQQQIAGLLTEQGFDRFDRFRVADRIDPENAACARPVGCFCSI